MEVNNINLIIIAWTSIIVTLTTFVLTFINYRILMITLDISRQAKATRKELQKSNMINKDIKRFIGGR
tara:strand:+ start:286 stop:489 length:204 start_codon:yes stop_codon:yes gene_type:complete